MEVRPVLHYRAESMKEKKNEAEQKNRPLDEEEREDERHQPSWIKKYLDLADLLMKRRQKDNERKAA